MNIMILLKRVYVRKSVFKDIYLKVTGTGVYFLLLEDKTCWDYPYKAKPKLPVSQAKSHNYDLAWIVLQLYYVYMCVCVWGTGKKTEIMGWLALVYILFIRVEHIIITESTSSIVYNGRCVLAFSVIVHWQSSDYKAHFSIPICHTSHSIVIWHQRARRDQKKPALISLLISEEITTRKGPLD